MSDDIHIEKIEIIVKCDHDDPGKVARRTLELLKTQSEKAGGFTREALDVENARLTKSFEDLRCLYRTLESQYEARDAEVTALTNASKKHQEERDVARATESKLHRRIQTLEGAAKSAQQVSHDGCNHELDRMRKARDEREIAHMSYCRQLRAQWDETAKEAKAAQAAYQGALARAEKAEAALAKEPGKQTRAKDIQEAVEKDRQRADEVLSKAGLHHARTVLIKALDAEYLDR